MFGQGLGIGGGRTGERCGGRQVRHREGPSGYRSMFKGADLQDVKILPGQIHMGKIGFISRKV